MYKRNCAGKTFNCKINQKLANDRFTSPGKTKHLLKIKKRQPIQIRSLSRKRRGVSSIRFFALTRSPNKRLQSVLDR